MATENILMSKKSVLQEIKNRIQIATEKELSKLQKEKDPIKQTKLAFEIQIKANNVVFDEVKSRSDKDFENLLEEVAQGFSEQYATVNRDVDDIMLKISKDSEEFDKYHKTKSIREKYLKLLASDLGESDLNKKQLERYLLLILLSQAQNDVQNMQNAVMYNELWRAINLVQRRLKFDHNWFTCLGLIQLHENLIKKKIVQLEGQIKGDEPVEALIKELSKLIKKKENQDVTLDLQMSEGLKKIRDLMTHEGYKHKVTKDTLKKITKDVEDLESVLYDEKFSICNS